MKIKRIEIHGFKSFADKTEINLGMGLTAVVGPNGSGKSNLAEAVKWVLGEQSARILRGQRMDDIIFSGTARRKGVGYAEVSLVFDNTDKLLPLEYSEAVITRRVYRSGEGEYLINRKACRLRDITELFLDTGVGKDSYSYVGQGRIEEILNADPRQRRGIFEEAAGISRYKLRKRETETRLDEVQANLRRLSDIEAELNMQLAPLQAEAERATRYLQLQADRDAWAKELLLYEIGLAERQVGSIRTQLERAADENRGRESRLSVLEAERSEFGMRHSALLNEVSRAEADLRLVEHDREQLRERLAELAAEMPSAAEEVLKLQEALSDASSRIGSIAGELELKRLELQSTEEALLRCETSLAAIAAYASVPVDQTSAGLAEEQALSIEKIASLRAEVDSRNRGLERAQEALARGRSDVARLADDIARSERKKGLLQQRHDETREGLASLKTEHVRLSARAASVRNDRITAEEKARDSQADLFMLQRKLESLRRAEEQNEGMTRAAKYVLELKLPRVKGALARLIDVPSPYVRAIEMSLGAALSDIVVADEATARRAIAELKDNKVGRATFYPLDIFRSRAPRAVPEELRRMPGYLGRASGLVACEEFVRPIVDHLLQNVLVVDNLETAGAVAGKTAYSFRIMTVDGDMMLPGGSISGGSLPSRTGNLLGRHQEMEEAEAQLRERETELAVSRTHITKLSAHAESLNREISAQDARVIDVQAEIVSLGQALSTVAVEHELLLRSHAALQAQLADETAETVRLRAAVTMAQAELQQALQWRDELDSRLASQRAAEAERLHLLQQSLQRQRDLELEQARGIARRELLVHVRTELNRDMQELKTQCCDLGTRLDTAERRRSAHEAQTAVFEQRMHELGRQKKNLEHVLGQAQDSRSVLQELERKNLAAVVACREAIEGGRSRLHALEIRLVRVEGELENLTGRLCLEHSAENMPSSTLSNRNEAELQIARLDEDIAKLGHVRVSSINECRRLQERLGFLATEGEDLATASSRLLQAISELDKVMAARFAASFTVVQREFSQVAERLFAGGAARVSMVDPSSPLDTGIEIDVQPPGKRLQNIRLLSGGERALAAVSLLCAVLRVKPTPFCVLDEVDAALDDANVERLIPVLRELSTHTQFLLVTHTKSTMLAADVLYGVTMPEQGVSRVLSVRVSEVSAHSQGET